MKLFKIDEEERRASYKNFLTDIKIKYNENIVGYIISQ